MRNSSCHLQYAIECFDTTRIAFVDCGFMLLYTGICLHTDRNKVTSYLLLCVQIDIALSAILLPKEITDDLRKLFYFDFALFSTA
jgi:hypothetical protein